MIRKHKGFLILSGLGVLALVFGCVANPRNMPSLPPKMAEGEQPMASEMKEYELPQLPYPYDALAPAISEEILRIHHMKHHAGYVKGLNAALIKLSKARAGGDMDQIKALSREVAFHGSGHLLHSLYWTSMKPHGSGEPTGKLREMIDRDFGSMGAFTAQFTSAAKEVEGSGWALLVYEPVGRRLLVLQVEKHQNLTVWGVAPLMACDVWEHAYYSQYQNRRADYVDNFFKIIDWPSTAERLKAALEADDKK